MNAELITAVAIGIGLAASLGNPVVATAENVAATGTSILALVIPFFILTLFLLLTILIFTVVRRRLRRSHNKNLSA